MWHETVQLYLEPGFAASTLEARLRCQLQALPGLVFFNLGQNLPESWGSGDFTLDLCFASHAFQESVEACLSLLPGIARVDRVPYQRVAGGERAPGLRDGIWRTLLFCLREGRSPAFVAALERDLLRMPAYMKGIGNWQLSRVHSPGCWTHVWQQEFARLEDLQGEYLTHPFHWGWVDRWFDPECPEWAVEAISHAVCPLASSVLTRSLSPDHKEMP